MENHWLSCDNNYIRWSRWLTKTIKLNCEPHPMIIIQQSDNTHTHTHLKLITIR